MWKGLLLLTAFAAAAFAAPDKFVCYLGSWANYRNGNCRFTIEDIDPCMCTHIIYGFVGITADGGIRIMDSWLDDDSGLGGFRRFTGLKAKNCNLKTLIAIGGWNEGSTTFSNVVSNPTLRAKFIANAIAFMKKYGFDGFDLDWEYPGQRGGAATDKINFSKLLAEMRAAFDNENPPFLLTAAVAAAEESAGISYEVPQLSQYLDFINVMTYDLHGAWDPVTGHNAPLYPLPSETGNARTLNVDACISTWIARGADPSKLILGIGTYGRTFTLASTSNTNIGAPATGGAPAGTCTGEMGILGYNEICQNLGTCAIVWNDIQKVPYAICGNKWIGFDNTESIALKVNYAKAKGLGGMMVWSLETDDFKGLCGEKNILLKAIRNGLGLPACNCETTIPTPTPPPTQPPTEPPTQPPTQSSTDPPVQPTTPSSGVCTAAGHIPDPADCGAFYQCVPDESGFTAYKFLCPAGLHFDASITGCNYPELAKCLR